MYDERYHNWDKDTNDDFWDLVERIDEINLRNLAVEIQKRIFKAEKYKALTYIAGFEGIRAALNDKSQRLRETPNRSRIRRNAICRRAISLAENGWSTREIADKVNVHYSTVCRWIKENRSMNNAGSRIDEDEFQCGDLVKEAGCQD